MKKSLLGLLVSCLLPLAAQAAPTVHIVGDSTVCIWSASVYPKMGWGQVIGRLFNTGAVMIDDKAVSGTSSKSFYDNSSQWVPVRNAIKSGDYVFIQFGHNDEKTGSGHTDPNTTYKDYLTKYIDETKARGGFPVLVTPVERNLWSGGKIVASHGDYPAAMRVLAVAKGVPLVDLTARSTAKYQSLGQTYSTTKIFMNLTAGQFPNYPNGNTDNTHFQENGAKIVSTLVTDGIRADTHTQMKTLAALLK